MIHKVYGFRDDYNFLSNFYPSKISYDGYVYPTVEHAYQASKAEKEADRKRIQDAASPKEAKKLGKQLKLSKQRLHTWEQIKLQLMQDLCKIKFSDPDLRQKLINTYPSELIEANWWGDTFWGVYNDQGSNHLGKILMKLREQLRNV